MNVFGRSKAASKLHYACCPSLRMPYSTLYVEVGERRIMEERADQYELTSWCCYVGYGVLVPARAPTLIWR